MKYENNLYWPDNETHLTSYGLEYQKDVRDKAIKLCRSRVLAVDVGAHVGIASLHFDAHFNNVLSFEPIPETFACLRKNINASGSDKILAVNTALSNTNHPISFSFNEGNTGYTVPLSAVQSEYTTMYLDQFHINPSLIKIDVEGFEANVIQGALETIGRSSPVLIIEAKGVGISKENPARPIEFLKELGYEVKEQVGADFILTRGW